MAGNKLNDPNKQSSTGIDLSSKYIITPFLIYIVVSLPSADSFASWALIAFAAISAIVWLIISIKESKKRGKK